MKRSVCGVLLAFLIAFQIAQAQQPLFIPVQGSEAAQVEAENEYFLKKHRYFAVRDQIVRVDGAGLHSAEPIGISLFGNDSLVVRRTDLKIQKDGAFLYWEGEVIDPAVPVDDLLRQNLEIEQIESIRSNLFTVSLAAVYYTRSGEKIRISPEDEHDSDENSFYEIDKELVAPRSGREYRITPLEMSPGYHILFLVDESKRVTEGSVEDPDHPEEALKRRRHQEFLEALGPDPRSQDFIRENGR